MTHKFLAKLCYTGGQVPLEFTNIVEAKADEFFEQWKTLVPEVLDKITILCAVPTGLLPNFRVCVDVSANLRDVLFATYALDQLKRKEEALKILLPKANHFLILFTRAGMWLGALVCSNFNPLPLSTSQPRIADSYAHKPSSLLGLPDAKKKEEVFKSELQQTLQQSESFRHFDTLHQSSQKFFMKLVNVLEMSASKMANAAKTGNQTHFANYQNVHTKALNFLCLLHCKELGSLPLLEHMNEQMHLWELECTKATQNL